MSCIALFEWEKPKDQHITASHPLLNRLKYALNYEEAKKITMQRLVKVDHRIRTDPNFSAGVMGMLAPFLLTDDKYLSGASIGEYTYIYSSTIPIPDKHRYFCTRFRLIGPSLVLLIRLLLYTN